MKSLWRTMLLLTLLMWGVGQASAGNCPWTPPNPHDYRYDMSLYLKVMLHDAEINYGDYTVGAFIGDDGACRGIGEVLTFGDDSQSVLYLRVRSNEPSGKVTVKVWDNSSGEVYSCTPEIDFSDSGLVGTPSSPSEVEVVIPVESIFLTASPTEIFVNGSSVVSAILTPSNTTQTDLTWGSSDTTVATVDADGKVTATAKPGTVTITATSTDNSSVSGSVNVSVKPIEVEAVTVTPASTELTIGYTAQLTATVAPANATVKTVTWSSSNTAVATVDADGKVTAKAVGTVTITATANNGKAGSATVKVNPIEVTSVTVTPANTELKIGGTAQLTATVTPANATVKTVTWSSSNTAVATVDADGKVTAKAVGTVTITATANNGKAGSATVKVNPIEVTSVTVTPANTELTIGSTAQLTATVAPANATVKTVTWSSSDTSMATVDANGNVTAKTIGTVTITATANNGKAGSATVKVTRPEDPVIEVTSVTVTPANTELKIGGTAQLSATVAPANATVKTVTWSCSDTSIATVDANGNVTAKAVGTVTITATANNGKSGSATVTVKEKEPEIVDVTGITLDPTSYEGYEGETFTITATVTPDNATDKTILWGSDNQAVATVDANGKVILIAEGHAVITARNGNVRATCYVTVIVAPVPVEQIDITPRSAEITEGTGVQLTATVLPANADNKELTWASSDTSVATVTAGGYVEGLAPGTARITATANDGSGGSGYADVTCIGSSVEMIFAGAETIDVYSPEGLLLKKNADREYVGSLTPGLYIVRTGGITRKIMR